MSDFDNFIKCVRSAYQTDDFIPLHEPRFTGNEKKYLLDTIETTFVSSVGAYVDKFEKQIADYTKTSKAAAIVNGTSAIQVALRIAGVSQGDEVITQALTFVATANAIKYNFADPVFVDVDYDTMGLSPRALKDFLEEFGDLREDGAYNKKTGKKISCILPMHTFGFMCRMDEICDIANRWQIPVVEDAAEALGSFYKNKAAGSWGLMGAFSFNGNKIITSGGGGAIVSSESSYAEKAKYLTNTAKVPHTWEYYHDELGYNFRMPNLNAALISAQLEQIDKFIESKKSVFNHYLSELKNEKYFVKESPAETDWNYWLISLQFENMEERDSFLKYSNDQKVMTRPIWKLMFDLPMYKDYIKDDQKNAKLLSETIVNIPSSAKI